MRKTIFCGMAGALISLIGGQALLAACQIEVQDTGESGDATKVGEDISSSQGVEEIVSEIPTAYSLDRGLVFRRVIAGPGAATAAAGAERLIYSNTRGIHAVSFPTNLPVSDDIAITAPNGCNLTRYKFKVLGRVRSSDFCLGGSNASQPCMAPADCPGGSCSIPAPGTPYTVTYGLYSNCPLAVGSTNALRDLVKIPGTDGVIAFDDDGPREIEHVVNPANPVALPTNFYLSLRFSRANCGTVVGTPALVGFSGDIFDLPGFPCNGYLGGFPQSPHASFWAEFFGDAACEEAHLGYKSARASGGAALIGANIQGVDDIQLLTDGCNMVSYEVAVRGVGFYTFDLRTDCDGQVIAGTQRMFQVNASTTPLLQLARFNFDPPIPIPQQLWLGFKDSLSTSGAVIAGINPVVGSSGTDYFTIDLDGCTPVLPTQGVYGNIHASIVCDGAPPMGACCDYHLRDEQGEAVCRQVPEINCFACASSLECPWIEGAACNPDPFPHGCGVFACCKPDDTCENLTKNQCDAAEPLDRPRLWQANQFCGEGNQDCPFNACLARQGDCLRVHPGTGCSDPFCCQDVCEFDSWCCFVEWDEICLRWADSFCPRAPSNDQCANGPNGAFEIPAPGILFGTNTNATVLTNEPGFCCHAGTGICQGGFNPGQPCLLDNECDGGGTCTGLEPSPGERAHGTVWHKFVATHSTAKISTCGSQDVDSRFSDSLLQVFAAGNPSTSLTACNSLSPIGCNDDAGAACPEEPANAELCVGGLTPGNTYYVLLASKLPQYRGRYRIELSAPCEPEPTVAGDYCHQAITAFEGVTPFDLAGATFDCPAAACSPTAQNDVWYNYAATCTGEAIFETCGDTSEDSPNTNLLVYWDCTKCPPLSAAPLECSSDALEDCGLGSRISMYVEQGYCYKVRLADEGGVSVAGNLTITCNSGDCQPNGIPGDQDIANCSAENPNCKDCNINGIPDECDLRDPASFDRNFNGKIDECETCPDGAAIMLSPLFGVIDARRPHAPGDSSQLQGIDSIQVAAFTGASPSCWSLCETNLNPTLHPPYPPELAQNAITSVTETQPGQYVLQFKRPITPAETTVITYTYDSGSATAFRLTAHPGNVNADAGTYPSDLLRLIDAINGAAAAPWGLYSTDCDHSGAMTPTDILCIIDLLNSGWNGTSRPPGNFVCP